ncbi:MAG: hypothetical protein V2J24_14400, partial [Pseudomonadales bacterium]|nr:hypothetical protein [Pseudomonadales bacterium]
MRGDVVKGSGGSERRAADIEALIRPQIAAAGCELWGFELLTEITRLRFRAFERCLRVGVTIPALIADI